MSNLLDKYFLEWTGKQDELTNRVSLFNNVRDMPYTLYRGYTTIEELIAKVLETKRGPCNPKHLMLGDMFKKLGIEIEYASFPMNWKEQKLDFPKEILQVAEKIPTVYHLALRVKIDDRWILVDATYDLPLEKIGAPVVKNWDGRSQTVIAVDFLDTVIHETKDQLFQYTQEKTASWTQEQHSNNEIFAKLMNEWLDRIRGKVQG